MLKGEKASRAIRAARNESEVLGAVREYLDSLDASDAALLPAELLVRGLTPAEELIQSALQALHSEIDSNAEKARGGVLNEAALVFTTAGRRLAALAKDPA
jgi:hypothetical protein